MAQTPSVVYSGDHLKTADGRALVALAHGGLIRLESNSGAVLDDFPGGFVMNLEKGQLGFSALPQHRLSVRTAGLTLSPTGSLPSLADVALGGDGSVFVAVHRGVVSIADLRPEPVLVSAGQTITVNPQLAQAQTQPVGTSAHGKMSLGEKLRTFRVGSLSHPASVAVLTVGLGAAAAAAVAVPLSIKESHVSPSAP
jgi:hypothetical protein